MKNFGEVWQKARSYFAADINPVAAANWVANLEPVRLDDDKAFFSSPSQFECDIVNKRYLDDISRALEAVLGYRVQTVVFVQEESPVDKMDEPFKFNPNAPAGEDNISSWTFKRYTFDSFVVGGGNAFAHAAALAVAKEPAVAYNPLLIYGNSGLGKTHLMCAIGNEIKKTHKQARVVYVKSEDFTNELIKATRDGNTLPFKEKYRNADVLLVDDIQFIAGKVSTQEEFFHTFNSLKEAGRQIVLTSDRPPKEISTLEDRLRTRFESGLIVDVQAPDYEVRCAIIEKKAQAVGITLSRDVVDFLATSLKDNVRQLEGAVTKMRAHYLLDRRPLNRELAAETVRDITSDSEPLEVKLDKIINEVARFYGCTADDITGTKRNAKLAHARKIAMYLIREITELSYPLIGEKFSGRNHTSVMYNCREVEDLAKKDFQLKSEINDFLKNLNP